MPGGKFRKLREETEPNNNGEIFSHKCLSCDRNTGWWNGEYVECNVCLADNENPETSVDW